MATDLIDRAAEEVALFQQRVDTLATRLEDVRAELTSKHLTPDTVDRANWAAQFGATQHLQFANAALAANRARQASVRAGLAMVTTPAEAGPQGEALGVLLVEEATLRVEARAAQERSVTAEALVASLSKVLAGAQEALRGAAARLKWGTAHQDLADGLRADLGTAPLDTMVVDAAAVRAGLTAAEDRLDALLPVEIRDRATARDAEAATLLADARAAMRGLEAASDGAAASVRPVDAAVEIAERDLARAETALQDYVAHAAGRLATAESDLGLVSQHDDLTAAQAAALDATSRADAVDALGTENDLATALAAAIIAQQALDVALLTATLEDPDADPELHAEVVAARAALADAAIQDPLAAARAAYDTAAQQALDEWEVEVPPSLWSALAALLAAKRVLEALADQAARDTLLANLDDATDALAQALTARDVAVRTTLAIAGERAERAAYVDAVEQLAAERRRAYVQGDGPSGRTADEL